MDKGDIIMIYELLFSATGRTQKVLDIFSNQWKEDKERIDLFDFSFDHTKYSFNKNDLCIVAVPVYGGRVPVPAAEKLKKLQGNGTNTIMIAVFGNRAVDDALLELKDILTNTGFIPFAGLEVSVQHSIIPQVEPDRPDAQDMAEIISFAERIKSLLTTKDELTTINVPGNYPYIDLGPHPFYPNANEKCKSCGLCAQNCPVRAISFDNLQGTDKEKCITCMRCVEICPTDARNFPDEYINSAFEFLKSCFEGRKPNKLYIAE